MSDTSCYVYLVEVPEHKQVLSVYCTVEGFSREQARVHIAETLNQRFDGESYRLLYLGVIDYAEVDADVIALQDRFFEMDDKVWILKSQLSS